MNNQKSGFDYYDAQGKFLRAKDIARILNISSSMAYRLIQNNEIASVRIGSAVRVRKYDLDAYIASHLSHANMMPSF